MRPAHQFTMRQVQANGVRFALIDEGDGPAVLMLHGFPDTAELWRHQIPPLVNRGFRVVAPDLRGRGATQFMNDPADYAVENMIEDVPALLDALKIHRSHLVAHDFGAGLAWLVSAFHPERVSHLAVMSVGHPATRLPLTLGDLQRGWYQLFMQFSEAENLLTQDGWHIFRTLLDHASDIETYIDDLSRPGRLSAALNWYRASQPMSSFVAPAPDLPRIQAPTLGIWSDGDIYLSEKRMLGSEQYVDGPWQYQRVDKASHWIPLDQPERVTKLLFDFLPDPTEAGTARSK
ncbi:MAG: alpha/beta fold hydrolase [Thermomicrobiales bacterium]